MNKIAAFALVLIVLASGCTITLLDGSVQSDSSPSSEESVFSSIDNSLISDNESVEIGSMV